MNYIYSFSNLRSYPKKLNQCHTLFLSFILFTLMFICVSNKMIYLKKHNQFRIIKLSNLNLFVPINNSFSLTFKLKLSNLYLFIITANNSFLQIFNSNLNIMIRVNFIIFCLFGTKVICPFTISKSKTSTNVQSYHKCVVNSNSFSVFHHLLKK